MTALDLDAIKRVHAKRTLQTGSATHGGGPQFRDICLMDQEYWPCRTASLVAEVERLQGRVKNLLGEQVAGIGFMRERDALRTTLAVIRGIGARSGTDLNAWNKAFDVIEDALRGPSDLGSTGSQS